MNEQADGFRVEMTTERAQEVLYESEAALRLLDQALKSSHSLDDDDYSHRMISSDMMPQIVDAATDQVMSALARIRQGRMEMHASDAAVGAQCSESGPAWSALVDIERHLVNVVRMLSPDSAATTAAFPLS